MTSAPPLLLVLGPAGHGVTRYGEDVASAVRLVDPSTRVVHVADVPAGERALAEAGPGARVHLHATDRLFGSGPEDAAEVVERWARTVRLTLTLHDVPQPSDGTMFARRRAAYTRMVAAVERVTVNSVHEQLLMDEFLPDAARAHAIALGARTGIRPVDPGVGRPSDLRVLIAGFVYPGKGHRPAVAAAARAAHALRAEGEVVAGVAVRAIGAPSRGHEADVVRLREEAAELGVAFEVTGFLDDAEFAAELVAPGIPLAAHEHVSASRSMLDWVEAGRRPLVVDSRYAAEMDDLRPGTLARYDGAELAARLAAAWRDPSSTRLAPGASLAPTLDDVAASYLAWWAA
ncbi:hypothetical protein [Microbacterium oleivorans]|uniref:hypothetical protein n=1 Tax=Microbacterium oleivorans TaxID=273677 RepID=UPI00203FDA12|nr:hypothetical protein [Microbacterium oleivorans]MCM3695301.1 hypothetical protein [Microbacterium oleivorans]